MSNLLNFKFGQWDNLPVEKSAGSVYVTTDEKAMYVDLPNKEGTIDRLRIGDIVVKDSVQTVEPPFYEDAFYYFVNENALLRYKKKGDGTYDWVQVNSRNDLEADLDQIKADILALNGENGEIAKLKAKDIEQDGKISGLEGNYTILSGDVEDLSEAVDKKVETSVYEQYVSDNNAAVALAQADATQALADAAAAQGTADEAKTAAEKAQGTADEALGFAKTSVQTSTFEQFQTSNSGVINAIDSRVGAIEGVIDSKLEADDLANYATKKYADDAATAVKTELLGDATNPAENTIRKLAADHTALSNKVSDVESTANAANLLSKANEEALGTKADISTLNDYAKKTDVTTAINGLRGNDDASLTVKSVSDALATLNNTVTNTQAGQISALETKVTTIETTTIPGIQTELAGVKKTADEAKAGLNDKLDAATFTTFKSGYDTKIKGIEGNISALQTASGEHGTAIEALQTAVTDTLPDAIAGKLSLSGGDMGGDINMADHKIITTATTFNDNELVSKSYVNGQITSVNGEITKVSGDLAAHKTAYEAFKETVVLKDASGNVAITGALDLNGKQIKNVAEPTESTDAVTKNYVDSQIDSKIAANDAMTFKGVLNKNAETESETVIKALPTVAANVGDTWKVGVAGEYQARNEAGELVTVNTTVGDLFINAAASDSDAPIWIHIPSGNEERIVQTLAAESNIIYLTDGVNNDIGYSQGQIKFVAEGGLKLEVTPGTVSGTHEVKASFVWEEFPVTNA